MDSLLSVMVIVCCSIISLVAFYFIPVIIGWIIVYCLLLQKKYIKKVHVPKLTFGFVCETQSTCFDISYIPVINWIAIVVTLFYYFIKGIASAVKIIKK